MKTTKRVTKRVAMKRKRIRAIKELIKDTIILGLMMFTPLVAMFTWWLVFGY